MIRFVLFVAGFFTLGLSLVSFVVPVLPTVPLLILTCFLFSKSSPRWHRWLLEHKHFGEPLMLWEAHGVIETRVKIMTTSVMSICLFYPFFFGGLASGVRLWIAICALSVFAFMWSRPGKARLVDTKKVRAPHDSFEQRR